MGFFYLQNNIRYIKGTKQMTLESILKKLEQMSDKFEFDGTKNYSIEDYNINFDIDNYFLYIRTFNCISDNKDKILKQKHYTLSDYTTEEEIVEQIINDFDL